jgi:hypothetical protein
MTGIDGITEGEVGRWLGAHGRPNPHRGGRDAWMRRPPDAPSRQAGGRRAFSGRREVAVPDHDANPDKPEGAGEPDWRRLLDGFAEPGRLRRLRDREQRQRPGRLRRLARRLRWRPPRRRA